MSTTYCGSKCREVPTTQQEKKVSNQVCVINNCSAKLERKMVKHQDIIKYQDNLIEELMKQNRSLNIFKKEMNKLRDGLGNKTEDRREILKVTEVFYIGL